MTRGECASGSSLANGPGSVTFAKLLGDLLAEVKRDEPHWARLA